MLQIYCKNNKETREFPEGTSLIDIYRELGLNMPYGPVSAKVNNKVENLNFRVYYNKDVEFLGRHLVLKPALDVLCRKPIEEEGVGVVEIGG